MLFPRQSLSSQPATSSDAATSTVASQSSALTDTATPTSSTPLPTSSTPASSDPVQATDTDSSLPTTTTTTTTPATTTTSTSFTPATSTSSTTPTSDSSSPTSLPTSSATSSAPPSSPSASFSTTPKPSSTQQEFTTIITSSFTTLVSGTPVVSQTAIATTIPYVAPSSSSTRTAIIAGSAAGGTALLILLLSLAFCARRKRFKQLDFLDAITRKRKRDRSRATLLDGDDLPASPTRPPIFYTDYDTPWDPRTPGHAQHPRTPSRWSETGSAFCEDVWPPPGEATRLMDPFARADPELDLSRIVDDVMGPSPAAGHYSDRSISSLYRDSVADSGHSRTTSSASNMALLEAAGLAGPTANAPVRSSPLAQG